jgi:hypothetical protein
MSGRFGLMSLVVLAAWLLIAAGASAATYQRMLILPQAVTIAAEGNHTIMSLCLDENRDAPGADDIYTGVHAGLGDVTVSFGGERISLQEALTASPPLARISGDGTRSHLRLRVENLDPRKRPMELSVARNFVLAPGGDAVGDVMPMVAKQWKQAPVTQPPRPGDGEAASEDLNRKLWRDRSNYAKAEVTSWVPGMASSLEVENVLALANLKAVAEQMEARSAGKVIPFLLIDTSSGVVGVAAAEGTAHILHRSRIAEDLHALQKNPQKPASLFSVGNLSADDVSDWRPVVQALQIDIVGQSLATDTPAPDMPRSGEFSANMLGDVATPELLKVIRVNGSPPPVEARLLDDPAAWPPFRPQPDPGARPAPPKGPNDWRYWLVAGGGSIQAVWGRAKNWLVVCSGGHPTAKTLYLTDRLENAIPQPATFQAALITYAFAYRGVEDFLDKIGGEDRERTVDATFWRGQIVGMRYSERERPILRANSRSTDPAP